MSKITIVTASYNKPELLRECGESILAQTDKDWTWLICLNGPTLDTKGAAYAMQAANPTSKILLTEVPVTEEERKLVYQPCKIANLLFDQVDSEYLAWLSDDDLIQPNFIAKMCNGNDASYCSVARYVQDGKEWVFDCINWATMPWQYGATDGGSMVIKKKVWDELGWRFSLDKRWACHADQQFMSAVNRKHPIQAVVDVLMVKRHAWNSEHQKGLR